MKLRSFRNRVRLRWNAASLGGTLTCLDLVVIGAGIFCAHRTRGLHTCSSCHCLVLFCFWSLSNALCILLHRICSWNHSRRWFIWLLENWIRRLCGFHNCREHIAWKHPGQCSSCQGMDFLLHKSSGQSFQLFTHPFKSSWRFQSPGSNFSSSFGDCCNNCNDQHQGNFSVQLDSNGTQYCCNFICQDCRFAHANTSNLKPFLPFGVKGIFQAAAIVYFAYGGFDNIATMAEETRNPSRHILLGVLGSMSIITVIYCLMALSPSMIQK